MDRLNYFKQKLLEILDKKEREERAEIRKSFDFLLDAAIEKSRGYAVGTIREWKGRKFKKMPNQKWVRVYDRRERSAEISIARLKGRVSRAGSVDELFDIVMKNTHRFSDENGNPLDIVLELKAAVDERKSDIAIDKELNRGYSKADAVKTIKEWATQENFDKAKGKTRGEIFFNFGQKIKVLGQIPEKYLKELNPKSNDRRVFCGKGYFIDHMVNHHPNVPLEDYELIPDVLESPDNVRFDDKKDVPTLIFSKNFGKYGTIVVNCKSEGDKVIFYKTGFTGNKESYRNKPSVVDRNPTISPSSAGGNGNVSALPDGNSNIPQKNSPVNEKPFAKDVCKSIKELKDFAKENYGIEIIQYDQDMDFSKILGSFGEVEKAVRQYPGLEKFIETVRYTKQKENDRWNGMYLPNSRAILIGSKNSYGGKEFSPGRKWSVSDSIEDTTAHEIGHAIAAMVIETDSLGEKFTDLRADEEAFEEWFNTSKGVRAKNLRFQYKTFENFRDSGSRKSEWDRHSSFELARKKFEEERGGKIYNDILKNIVDAGFERLGIHGKRKPLKEKVDGRSSYEMQRKKIDGDPFLSKIADVSVYALTNDNECIAECFLDVQKNKEKAKPLSRAVMEVLNQAIAEGARG